MPAICSVPAWVLRTGAPIPPLTPDGPLHTEAFLHFGGCKNRDGECRLSSATTDPERTLLLVALLWLCRAVFPGFACNGIAVSIKPVAAAWQTHPEVAELAVVTLGDFSTGELIVGSRSKPEYLDCRDAPRRLSPKELRGCVAAQGSRTIIAFVIRNGMDLGEEDSCEMRRLGFRTLDAPKVTDALIGEGIIQ
jgi:hypothetical protein